MKFSDMDAQMRMFETAHDHEVLPDMYIVARLDGRGFTSLIEDSRYKKPFDDTFRHLMTDTTRYLMRCGFKIIYGYTQSDEISLLFAIDDITFNRKVRKINSILAGEASAYFTIQLAMGLATFDCRVSQLPNIDRVVDYFRWRQEGAFRNCLNSFCYWSYRSQGLSARKSASKLVGVSNSGKKDILKNQFGIDTDIGIANWCKHGVGLYWDTYTKQGYNPKTQEAVQAQRNYIKTEMNLPYREQYENFIRELLNKNS